MARASLKTKITLAVALLIGVLTAVVVTCALGYFTAQFRENVAAEQRTMVQAMAGEVDDKILAAQRELSAVAASMPPALYADAAGLQRFLDSRHDLAAVFSGGVGYLSPSGRVLATSNPHDPQTFGLDISFRDYFQATLRTRRPFISEPHLSMARDHHPKVTFTAPLLDGRGNVAGILCGGLDLLGENFLGRLTRHKIHESGHFYLLGQSGEMIIHRDHRRVLTRETSEKRNRIFRSAVHGVAGSAQSLDPSGTPVLTTFVRLKSTGWVLAAEVPLVEIDAPMRKTRELVLVTLAVVLCGGLCALWFFIARLTAPLAAFTRQVAAVDSGADSHEPIPVPDDLEIGVLVQTYNRLMGQMAQQRRALEDEKTRAEKLLFSTAVPSFVIDAEHRVTIWNRACEELTGVPGLELVGRRAAWRGFYPEERPVLADFVLDGRLWEMADLYERYADSPLIPEGLRAEGWFRLKGKDRYLSFDAAPVRDKEGNVIAAVQTLQDITLRKSREDELRTMVAAIGESEERFRRLVQLSLDGIVLLVERRFVFVNPAGCDLLACPVPEELLGRDIAEFVERESAELFEEQLRYVEQNGKSSPWLEQRLVREDHTTLEVELGASPFIYEGKKALQVIFRDITERNLAKARLETLAHYDALTSLPNRVLFFDRLHHVSEEAKRHGYPLALLFLDLDRFKNINDTLGHQAGDAVLVEVGQRLKGCLRSCDMVARMGGDEFTVILSKVASEEDAALVAERILDTLCVPFMLNGEARTIGVSIGICVYPSAAKDVTEMVSHADSAMYQVKQAGRNGYCFYSEGIVCYGDDRKISRKPLIHPQRVYVMEDGESDGRLLREVAS